MKNINKASQLKIELISLIKIYNYIEEKKREHMDKIESYDYDNEYILFLHTIEENVSIDIDLHIENIEKYEDEINNLLY